jgi:hypothetical protein
MKKLQNTSFYFLIIILLISCGQKTKQDKTEQITELTEQTVINIQYRQPINGYNVKVRLENNAIIDEFHVGTGYIEFTNDKDTFSIFHLSFALLHSLLNNPQKTTNNNQSEENELTYIIDYDYESGSSANDINPFKRDMPFFFADVNFDNRKDLIINYHWFGQRGGSIYRAYLNNENNFTEVLSLKKLTEDFGKFDNFSDDEFELDDFTMFDYKNKEIIIHLSGGAYSWLEYFYKLNAKNEFELYKVEDVDRNDDYLDLKNGDIVITEYKVENGEKVKVAVRKIFSE